MLDKIQIFLLPVLTTAQTLNVEGVPNRDTNADDILVHILNGVYLIAGIVAVVAIIFGGFWYITSDGQPDKIKRGKNAIIYAIIGIVVIVSAWALTGFIAGQVEV